MGGFGCSFFIFQELVPQVLLPLSVEDKKSRSRHTQAVHENASFPFLHHFLRIHG